MVYPNTFDTFDNPAPEDPRNDPSLAGGITQIQDVITAIQETLGLNPQSVYTSVAERLTAVAGGSIPPGVILDWAGSDTSIPAGWLLCNGLQVSRTVYSSLFAVIGTQFGIGDGSTTFNLPNFKGRVAVGKDSTVVDFDTIAKIGGARTHTLNVSQIPSHTHGQDGHEHEMGEHIHSMTHSHTGNTSESGSHSHTGNTADGGAHNHGGSVTSNVSGEHNHLYYDHPRNAAVKYTAGTYGQDRYSLKTNTENAGGHQHSVSIANAADHVHGMNIANAGTHLHTLNISEATVSNTGSAVGGTTSNVIAVNLNTGGSTAHNNLQPYLVVSKIIKI